jgi:hypothetical protein
MTGAVVVSSLKTVNLSQTVDDRNWRFVRYRIEDLGLYHTSIHFRKLFGSFRSVASLSQLFHNHLAPIYNSASPVLKWSQHCADIGWALDHRNETPLSWGFGSSDKIAQPAGKRIGQSHQFTMLPQWRTHPWAVDYAIWLSLLGIFKRDYRTAILMR